MDYRYVVVFVDGGVDNFGKYNDLNWL